MKKIAIIVTILYYASSIQADIFSDIGKTFTKAGKSIADVSTQVGEGIVDVSKQAGEQTYEHVIKPTGELIVDTGERLAECATMVGLGTEWAAKQAALNTANGSLEALKGSTQGIAFMGRQLAILGGQAINIQEISFEASAKVGIIPLRVKGVFFGQRMTLTISLRAINKLTVGHFIDMLLNAILKELRV